MKSLEHGETVTCAHQGSKMQAVMKLSQGRACFCSSQTGFKPRAWSTAASCSLSEQSWVRKEPFHKQRCFVQSLNRSHTLRLLQLPPVHRQSPGAALTPLGCGSTEP